MGPQYAEHYLSFNELNSWGRLWRFVNPLLFAFNIFITCSDIFRKRLNRMTDSSLQLLLQNGNYSWHSLPLPLISVVCSFPPGSQTETSCQKWQYDISHLTILWQNGKSKHTNNRSFPWIKRVSCAWKKISVCFLKTCAARETFNEPIKIILNQTQSSNYDWN